MHIEVDEEPKRTYCAIHNVVTKIDQVIFSINYNSNAYIYISPSCERVYGYTPNDFMQCRMLWRDVIHPADIEILSTYEARLEKGETIYCEYRITHKKGSIKWLDVKGIPTLNTAGAIERVDVIVTDITERREAQQKMEKAHYELDRMLNSINEVLFSVDMEAYKLTHVSAASIKVYGYTPAEFYSNGELWNEVVHPDDKSIAQAHHAELYKGKEVSNQYRIIHKSGLVRWIENKITPTLNNAGKLLRIDGVTSDITDRKKAELELLEKSKELMHSKAALSAIIENTDADIYSIDRDFRYITYNDSLKKNVMAYLGVAVKPGDKAFGHLEQSNPAEAAEWKKIYEDAFAGKHVSFVKDYGTAEQPAFVSFSITPIWEDGIVSSLSCFARNITQQKLMERKAIELNQLLEQKVKERTMQLEMANAELESFSYSVSHDLRAPIRVMQGFAAVLKQKCAEKLNSEEKEILNSMVNGGKHMEELIDDLLAFSRIDRNAVNMRTIAMNELVEIAIRETSGSYPQCSPKFVTNDLGNAVGDAGLVRQVWCNLISNAIKYSAKVEQPLIEIGATTIDGIQTYYVKDNGTGFDMKYADKLFTAFQRLHNASEYEGTGVGLALCNKIVTRHHGKIWATAEIGKGATFYFTLTTQVD